MKKKTTFSKQQLENDRSSVQRFGLFALLFATLLALSSYFSAGSALAGPLEATGGTIPDPSFVSLAGPLQAKEVLDDENALWTVAGVPVLVTRDTRIIERVGPAVIGASVKVQGRTDDTGTISARRIKVVPKMPFVKLFGTLLRQSDSEVSISGILVGIGPLTLKPAVLEVDKPIWVKGTLDTGNNILALIMRQKADDDDDDHDGPTVLIGRIQILPDSPNLEGRWRVSGIPVLVTDATKLSRRMGPFRQGAWVKVVGVGSSEGGIVAARVRTTRSHRAHILKGTFEGRENGEVIVDKIHVELSHEPIVIGNPKIGKVIVVESRLKDNGKMKAFRLLARQNDHDGEREIHFAGTIDELPDEGLIGTWVISGRTVRVREATEIDQSKADAEVGAKVKVHAVVTPNENRSTDDEFIITATEIVVVRPASDDDDDDHGRQYVEFVGEVEDLPANGLLGIWSVGGLKVVVGARTEIEGDAAHFAVGALVKVEGYQPKNGPIVAREVKLVRPPQELPDGREIIFGGIVEEMPESGLLGLWLIQGIEVEVVADTEIDESLGELGENTAVIVVGTMQPDGSVLAAKIKTAVEDVDEPVRYTKFKGVVKRLPDNPALVGEWVVVDRHDEMVPVHVTQGTIIHKRRDIAVGTKVEVEGIFALDHSVIAFKIKALDGDDGDEHDRSIRFHGLVEAAPDNADGIGEWTIVSRPGRVRTVVAVADTEFEDGVPVVGDPVEVKGKLMDDGKVLALKIESESDSE